MGWGNGISAWADKLAAAWDRGDMPSFRELAGLADQEFSDGAMDLHAAELFDGMGRALVKGISAAEGAARALAQIDIGFGPQDSAALDFLRGRRETASLLDSAGWRTVPYQLRDRAFFSSRVNDLRTLAAMKARIAKALAWTPGQPNGPVMDGQRFAKEMRAILINGGVRTARPEDLGGLKDIMSVRRLELIHDVQTEMARGFGAARRGMDPDILDAVPGYRFTRIAARRNPRPDGFWMDRWAQACAMAGGVGCLARPAVCLKTSPALQALGSLGPFGNPFAPFDWGSGMGLEDLDRAACEAAGLLRRNEPMEPAPVPDLDARMEEGVEDVPPALLDRLDLYFGDQVSVDGGRAVWRKPAAPYLSAAEQGWESAAEWQASEPMPLMDVLASEQTLRDGFTVADAAGRALRFSGATLEHIRKDPNRLLYLKEAAETVRHPQEVVIQEKQRGYFRAVEEGGRRRYVTVFAAAEDVEDTPAGEVRTYYIGKTAGTVDKSRRGTGRITYRR